MKLFCKHKWKVLVKTVTKTRNHDTAYSWWEDSTKVLIACEICGKEKIKQMWGKEVGSTQ